MSMQNVQNAESATELFNFAVAIGRASDNFAADLIDDDMEGIQLSFPRAKVPNGSMQFEIESGDPERPDYTPTLVGIVLYNHRMNGLWAADENEDEKADAKDRAPLCSAVNGQYGVGSPGGTCATCGMNVFGSGERGGKACKNMRVLYLLRSGETLPLQLTLAPTSLRPWRNFCNVAFLRRNRPTCGTVIEISLKRVDDGGKRVYSVANFRKLFDLEGEALQQAVAASRTLRDQVKASHAILAYESVEPETTEVPGMITADMSAASPAHETAPASAPAPANDAGAASAFDAFGAFSIGTAAPIDGTLGEIPA